MNALLGAHPGTICDKRVFLSSRSSICPVEIEIEIAIGIEIDWLMLHFFDSDLDLHNAIEINTND